MYLSLPSGTYDSGAVDVNDLGVAAGYRNGQACIWQADGTFVLLPMPEQFMSAATAVNESSVVAGWRNISDGTTSPFRVAFMWKDRKLTDIDPSEAGFNSAKAVAISDEEHVVGNLSGGAPMRGFRWRDGVLEVLQPLPGATHCRALGVNRSGLVVGDSQFYEDDGVTQHFEPTVWDRDGQPQTLQLLPGYTGGTCIAVNNLGQVLGSVSNPTVAGLPSFQRVTWIGGVPIPIRPLIGGPNPALLNTPVDLNDVGQVLAGGVVSPPSGSGVWLLTPETVHGDLNNDCQIDGSDLQILIEVWGRTDLPTPADFDGSGTVDGADLGFLLSAWTTQER